MGLCVGLGWQDPGLGIAYAGGVLMIVASSSRGITVPAVFVYLGSLTLGVYLIHPIFDACSVRIGLREAVGVWGVVVFVAVCSFFAAGVMKRISILRDVV